MMRVEGEAISRLESSHESCGQAEERRGRDANEEGDSS